MQGTLGTDSELGLALLFSLACIGGESGLEGAYTSDADCVKVE